MCHLSILVQVYILRCNRFGTCPFIDARLPGVGSMEQLVYYARFFLFVLHNLLCQRVFRLSRIALVFTYYHDAGKDNTDGYKCSSHQLAYLPHWYSAYDHHA